MLQVTGLSSLTHGMDYGFSHTITFLLLCSSLILLFFFLKFLFFCGLLFHGSVSQLNLLAFENDASLAPLFGCQ